MERSYKGSAPFASSQRSVARGPCMNAFAGRQIGKVIAGHLILKFPPSGGDVTHHTELACRRIFCVAGRLCCAAGRLRCAAGRLRCAEGRSRCVAGRLRCAAGRSRCEAGRLRCVAARQAGSSQVTQLGPQGGRHLRHHLTGAVGIFGENGNSVILEIKKLRKRIHGARHFTVRDRFSSISVMSDDVQIIPNREKLIISHTRITFLMNTKYFRFLMKKSRLQVFYCTRSIFHFCEN